MFFRPELDFEARTTPNLVENQIFIEIRFSLLQVARGPRLFALDRFPGALGPGALGLRGGEFPRLQQQHRELIASELELGGD